MRKKDLLGFNTVNGAHVNKFSSTCKTTFVESFACYCEKFLYKCFLTYELPKHANIASTIENEWLKPKRLCKNFTTYERLCEFYDMRLIATL